MQSTQVVVHVKRQPTAEIGDQPATRPAGVFQSKADRFLGAIDLGSRAALEFLE